MPKVEQSLFRRLTMHLWRPPARDPTMFGTCDLDVSKVQALSAQIAAEGGPKVTLLHAVALAIARSYRRYPELNSKVVGRRIVQLHSIDMTFPVSLRPEQPGDLEMLFGKVDDLDRLTLPQAAEAFAAAAERTRRLAHNPVTRWGERLGRYVPDSVLAIGMNQGWELFKRVDFGALGVRHHPFGSTAISNLGAIRPIEGLTGLSAMALILPMGYSSSYLLGPTVERPVVVDGQIVARPVVSLTYGIDHRVLDGFGFMRYADYWTQCFRAPERFLMGREEPHA